jgi:hypothetical protein
MSALCAVPLLARDLPVVQVCEVVLRARVCAGADVQALRGALEAASDRAATDGEPMRGPLLRLELFRPAHDEQVLLVTIERTVYALQIEGPARVSLDEPDHPPDATLTGKGIEDMVAL